MGFWSLFVVASTPIEQVLLIGLVGAYLASSYSNVLNAGARKDINKVVFTVFTPSLMFASLAKTVTLKEIVSWWFMPVNIGFTFLFGAVLGWMVVKIFKPDKHLEGLVVATCCAGNLGNLMLILVPSLCDEEGNPFGERGVCSANALSYVSFSMALGGFYIWTYAFGLMKKSGSIYEKIQLAASREVLKANIEEIDGKQAYCDGEDDEESIVIPSSIPTTEIIEQKTYAKLNIPLLLSSGRLSNGEKASFWGVLKAAVLQIAEELMAPPTLAAIIGFIFGAVPWLKSLVVGTTSPLRVVLDSITLLGEGTIPCITLILGGNLTQGFRKSTLKPLVIAAAISVKFILLPVIGIGVVKLAGKLGFLPEDPLYHYVLMIQFALPPAMNIATMAELFHVAKEECSVIFLCAYVFSTLSLTVWSMIFLSILS